MIRDAATVIVARDASDGPHVFLVRRSSRAAWLSDIYVFPGGAVDDDDHALAPRLLAGASAGIEPGYVVTAARETFEEAGMLFADRPVSHAALAQARRALLAGEIRFGDALAQLGARVDAAQLHYFSRWITPPTEARRFDTRFFVARAPHDQIAEADAAEVHDGRWVQPAAALAAYERGELGLIFPTVKHLERIAPFRSVDELLDFTARKPIVTISPDVSDERIFTLRPELENAW